MTEEKNQIITHFEKFISVGDSLKAELLNRFSLVTFHNGGLIIDSNKLEKLFYSERTYKNLFCNSFVIV